MPNPDDIGRGRIGTDSEIEPDLGVDSGVIGADLSSPPFDFGDDSDDDSDCECTIPELAVGRNEVGAFDVQIVYCEECEAILRTVIEPISE